MRRISVWHLLSHNCENSWDYIMTTNPPACYILCVYLWHWCLTLQKRVELQVHSIEYMVMAKAWIACAILFSLVFAQQIEYSACSIGVCYGMLGDNLPPPGTVVGLYTKYNIRTMRLYYPDTAALEALRSSGISVALGVKNEDIADMASNVQTTDNWVNSYVASYGDAGIQYVVVGNEAIPGDQGKYVAPAIANLRISLNNKGFAQIIVTTALSGTALVNTYPPSQTTFSPDAIADVQAVIDVLKSYGDEQHVVMANVYPYLAYAADPQNISIEYAQFLSPQAVVIDGPYSYYNLFDAMVDGYYAAMEKVGGEMLRVVVSESGWPTAGNGAFTTPDLAQTYNRNLINHADGQIRTPRKPDFPIEGFIFAMFNEDLKSPGIEQNWGLFYPDGSPVYPLF